MNLKIKKILSKKNKSKIICLTSYSKNFSEILDKYTDIILVGDSLGSVLYSFDTTKKVKLDMMIQHSKSVRQGINKSLMVVDMPYNSYRNKFEALKNAKKIIKYSKADAIKLNKDGLSNQRCIREGQTDEVRREQLSYLTRCLKSTYKVVPLRSHISLSCST